MAPTVSVCNRSAVKEPESHSGQDQPGLRVVYGRVGQCECRVSPQNESHWKWMCAALVAATWGIKAFRFRSPFLRDDRKTKRRYMALQVPNWLYKKSVFLYCPWSFLYRSLFLNHFIVSIWYLFSSFFYYEWTQYLFLYSPLFQASIYTCAP